MRGEKRYQGKIATTKEPENDRKLLLHRPFLFNILLLSPALPLPFLLRFSCSLPSSSTFPSLTLVYTPV